MNLVSRQESRVVIRQVPVLLWVITAFFSLPPLAFSLAMILNGTDADGKYFGSFFGLTILWASLEFIATRERIEIDLTNRILTRAVSGVFRHRQQTVNLAEIIDITLERWVSMTATQDRRQCLYMNGRHERFLLNTPAKAYLDHRKLAQILHDVTLLPYRELRDGKEVNA